MNYSAHSPYVFDNIINKRRKQPEDHRLALDAIREELKKLDDDTWSKYDAFIDAVRKIIEGAE